MRNVYTVKQLNSYIKEMFTQDFMLNRIYVQGEVSNCKYHTSGHIYFSLKDSSGTISCVMFAGYRAGLSFRMQDGQQVIVLGTVSVYERDGRYQLYAKEIIPSGAGLLYEKFEALKKKLEETGMFSEEYKRPIPKFAKTVGIVTAPTGAAVRDIIQISARRNPYVQLVLYPALVQGDGAAESIIRGIRALEAYGVDVMIVGRGGGSIEDLWAFNEESVARAVFDCTVPVISAVGHETDTTITDYVADLRAPTPSAAAELAVYEILKVEDALAGYRELFLKDIRQNIYSARQRAQQYQSRIKMWNPSRRVFDERKSAEELARRLSEAMEGRIKTERQRVAIYAEKLKGLSPLTRLTHGFSYVEDGRGKNVRSVSQLSQGDKLKIYFADGTADTEVRRVTKGSRPGEAGNRI